MQLLHDTWHLHDTACRAAAGFSATPALLVACAWVDTDMTARPRTSTASAPLLPVTTPDVVATGRARPASPLARVLKALKHRAAALGWTSGGRGSRKATRGSRAGVTLAVLLLIAGLRKLLFAPASSGSSTAGGEGTNVALGVQDDATGAADTHLAVDGPGVRATGVDWCASQRLSDTNRCHLLLTP